MVLITQRTASAKEFTRIVIAFLLIALFFACVLGFVRTSTGTLAMGMPGGRQSVAGAQNDLELESLAKFAVDQQNAKQNSSLAFVRLVSAEKQVVSGTMYYLDLEATNPGSAAKLYEAKVWVKPWQHFKSLEEFKEKPGA